MTTKSEPSPTFLFDTLNGTYRIAAVRAAIGLELFTAIGDAAKTSEELAQAVKASHRGVRILCDALVVMGFLTKEGNRYRLTLDSAAYLDKKSPLYFGGVIDLFGNPFAQMHLADPVAVVRAGTTIIGEEGTMAPEHEWWVPFARLMAPMMAIPAQKIAEALAVEKGGAIRVLDIAAGHGLFGIAIAERNPSAHIVAVDWKPVLAVAKENADKAGITDRYETIAGSAFDVDLGSGYDVVLMTNFLHHFDPPTCEKLLRKIHGVMKPGGRLATLEFVVNEDRVSPPTSALFAMIMLTTTKDGDAYTFSELSTMAKNTGFPKSELVPLGRQEQRLVISQRD